MTPAAILAIISTAQMFIDNPLVKRMLQNAAKHSANKIDDMVIEILYGAAETVEPKEQTAQKLEAAQADYDKLSDEAKAEAKATPSATITPEASRIIASAFSPAGVD